MVLKAGEPAYHDTTGLFKLGDGVTALSALSFLPTVSASTPTLQQVLTAGNVATTTIETTGFITTGGTFGQFLKADGSVDGNYYLTYADISASTPLNYSNLTGVFSINQSSALSDGYLSSTDWSTFNGKTTLAAVNAQNLSVFAATTSSQLAGVISDETGSGALVFGTSPTFTTNITTPLINGTSGTLQIGTTDLVNIGNKTTTSQRIVRIGQDTAWIDIGSQSGSTARAAIYLNTTTPDTTNYALSCHQTTGSTYLNSSNTINLLINGGILHTFTINTVTFAPTLRNGGSNTPFTFTCGADLNQVASTNTPYFKITGSTKTFLTGTLATQYFNYLSANTLAFTGASTATLAANFVSDYVQGGTNATITTNTAIHVPTLALTNTTYGTGMYIVAPTGATTNTAAKFLQNNGQVDIGSIAAGYSTIWMGQATPSGSNYTILMTGSTACVLHASGTVGLSQNQGTHSLILGSGILTFSDTTLNCVFGSTNGTKLGTATTQKLAFWNATPVVQPTAVTTVQDFYNAMSSIGLIAAGTITLPTGYAKSINNIAINTTAGATGNTDYYYFCTSTLTLTLPTAIGNTNTYYIKVTSGTLTINTTSSQTIDGSLTVTTSILNTSFTVISDGTNWQII
jgi:hypothetical protein